MQLHSTLISTLLLALTITPSFADPIPRARGESEHKFSKRSPKTIVHHHYHSSPAPAPAAPASGGGGLFGGSTAKTIAAGTALAGAGAFAGTAGSMAAHHVFGGHHDDDDDNNDREEKGSRGGDERVAQQGGGGQQLFPVYEPVPGAQGQRAWLPSEGGVNNSPNAGGGGKKPYPVAMLMSDGSYEPLPPASNGSAGGGDGPGLDDMQQGASPRYGPTDLMGPGIVFPNKGAN